MAFIAMAALSLLLLRPACDILALQLKGSQAPALALLHHPSQASAEHGGALDVGSHATGLAAAAGGAKGLPLPAAPISPVLVLPALAFFFLVAAPGAAPPPPRSYYARSTRILR